MPRRLHRANAHAADMLGITGVVTHDLIAARLNLVTMNHCPEVIEALRHLSRSTLAGPVDATATKAEYCEASSVWCKSLARALTQAEGYARHGDSAHPPRRRHCTKPPEMLQVEAAMSIIDHGLGWRVASALAVRSGAPRILCPHTDGTRWTRCPWHHARICRNYPLHPTGGPHLPCTGGPQRAYAH